MTEVTYESLEPLLVSAVRVGDRIECIFRCPVTGTELEASAPVTGELGSDTPALSFWPGIRLGVLGALQGALGKPQKPQELDVTPASDAALRQSILTAFESVCSYFVWNGSAWVCRGANDVVREFASTLKAAPLSDFDREILGRILWRLVRADGTVAPAEKSLLREFGIAAQPEGAPVTQAELSATTPGYAREVMLLLAWTVAFSDERLDLAEIEELERLVPGLELGEPRSLEIKRLARLYVVNLALAQAYRSGRADAQARDQVRALARKIGLDVAEFSRLETAYQVT